MSKDQSKSPSGIADGMLISGIRKVLSERLVNSDVTIYINAGVFQGRICETDDEDVLVLHRLKENIRMVVDINHIYAVEWAR